MPAGRDPELKSHLTIKYVKIVQIGNEMKHFSLMFRSINWKKVTPNSCVVIKLKVFVKKSVTLNSKQSSTPPAPVSHADVKKTITA